MNPKLFWFRRRTQGAFTSYLISWPCHASLPTENQARFLGDQSHRVAIASALAPDSKLIVLDEAVSAVAVLAQEQILHLLQELQPETEISYLFISHDLAAVREIADTVHVMNKGQIVESDASNDLFFRPNLFAFSGSCGNLSRCSLLLSSPKAATTSGLDAHGGARLQ